MGDETGLVSRETKEFPITSQATEERKREPMKQCLSFVMVGVFVLGLGLIQAEAPARTTNTSTTVVVTVTSSDPTAAADFFATNRVWVHLYKPTALYNGKRYDEVYEATAEEDATGANVAFTKVPLLEYMMLYVVLTRQCSDGTMETLQGPYQSVDTRAGAEGPVSVGYTYPYPVVDMCAAP